MVQVKRDEALRILAEHRKEIAAFCVTSRSLFGSVARDKAGPKGDVDVLVEFGVPVGLFEFVRLQRFLAGILGRKVELATPEAIRERMREQVLRSAVRAT